ncbi:Glucosamine--fructose-6-phosphate aminotransferase [isomerizing] [hydrothermal vent metagenome]|uniref:Glutamine--fructose-6-phosphate aminotransferase [isomerizing] n=1 Tax=hydrothermal vent metagenome TaxID=652676 RepID=A0A1W1CDK7_9ZZZZ
MCGIIAGISKNNIESILLEGLSRLEYRGYDSSGIVVINDGELKRHRATGKVAELKILCKKKPLNGNIGIAHTRWATHGKPIVNNAHPHICNNALALVHNGIIENHTFLRNKQQNYRFTSETDTETLVHQIDKNFSQDLLSAVQQTVLEIEGAYAFALIHKDKQELVATRHGSPLVLGIGDNGFFVASDVSALIDITDKFIFLEEKDTVRITTNGYQIYDENNQKVIRKITTSDLEVNSLNKNGYKHFMLKEIYEQPSSIEKTIAGKLNQEGVLKDIFGNNSDVIFSSIKQIQIIACGTSYHAGLVAKYWIEDIVGIPVQTEVASEYRYRNPVLLEDTLIVTISQSGETADTLAALKNIKKQPQKTHSLVICNVAQSSLVRESDLVFLTQAGHEIGVASTKAFTTQLTALMMFVISLAQQKNLDKEIIKNLIKGLNKLPTLIEDVLNSAPEIERLASCFAGKNNALFLGRGLEYPIAMEGALKLKEISYIHAEAYPAGELKHGPLALIDDEIPVVAVAPNNSLLKKLKANIEEVQARGGELFVFADSQVYLESSENFHLINIAKVDEIFAPIVFTIPLQLLSYYVALIKGTDIDQPRNLAKAVTVE